MPKALLPTSSRVYSDFYFYIYFKIIITNIIYFRVERQVVAAGTSVAPPERPSHSQKASFLPPPSTVSSSRARVNREPKITATKEATPSVDEDASSDSGNDCSKDYSDTNSGSGTDDDSDGDSYTKPSATPIRRGPPSRSQPKQHNEPVMATAETSDHGILDVEMHSHLGGDEVAMLSPLVVLAVLKLSSQVEHLDHMGELLVAKLLEMPPTLPILMQLKMTLPPSMLRALSICFLLAPDQPLLILMKQL